MLLKGKRALIFKENVEWNCFDLGNKKD